MSIFISGNQLLNRYVGNQQVLRSYQGNQLVWSSGDNPWPRQGYWSGQSDGTGTSVASFTIPEDGVYDLDWEVTWPGTELVSGLAGMIVNGTPYSGPLVVTAPGTSDVHLQNEILRAGDLIEFVPASTVGTFPATGSWTVNRTGDIPDLYEGSWSYLPFQPPQEPSDLGTWTAPRDMVVNLEGKIVWQTAQPDQSTRFMVGNKWVAFTRNGQSTQIATTRVFVPEGTMVKFQQNNGTPSGSRNILSAEWSVKETLDDPFTSGQVMMYPYVQNAWGELGNYFAPRAMTVTAKLIGFSWAQPTSSSNRRLAIGKNNSILSMSGDEATSIEVTGISVAKGDIINFSAGSESPDAAYRIPTAGTWVITEQT